MKKQVKKMVLSKETLRNLETKGELARVAGGASAYACTESVCCSGIQTCNCPGTTGTSRYC
ncbi:MAG TPA: hypothetical protein VLB76_03715 [Thermoanaerobaculia bacterium]|nr:hypothetical protein [Thermoanaerobaculia bacterium]